MAARCVLPVRAHRAPGADDGRGSRAGEWTSRPAAREPCPAGTRKTGSPERSLTGWVPVSRSGRAVTVTGMSNAASHSGPDRPFPSGWPAVPSLCVRAPDQADGPPDQVGEVPASQTCRPGSGTATAPPATRVLCPAWLPPTGPVPAMGTIGTAVGGEIDPERRTLLRSAVGPGTIGSGEQQTRSRDAAQVDRRQKGWPADWRRRVRRSAIRGRRRRWVAGDVHRPRSPACPRPGDGGHLTGPRYLRAVRHRLRATPRQRQTRTVPVTSGRRS